MRRRGVERAGWLVGQQDARIVDERASDGDALLLASRQLIWSMMEPIREAHGFELSRSALSLVDGGMARIA